MFPLVPSNSLLHVIPPRLNEIRPGEIICYPGRHEIIAHRVIRIEQTPSGRTFITRGDAVGGEEQVAEGAVAWTVVRVERGRFAYDVDSAIGRCAAALALHRGLPLRLLSITARTVVGLRNRLRARSAWPERADVALGDPPPPRAGSSESPDALLRLLNHELRTPLNGILGFIEILLGELDGPLLLDERENLSLVRDAGRQLLSLVSDVLDLVAAVANDHEPMYESVDLGELLEAERVVLEERRGMRPVYVRVDVPLEAAAVVVDCDELARLLRLLGELALQATSSGEVSFEAESGESEVCVRVRADGPLFPEAPPRADRPSSPAERDDRLRRMRFDMAQRLTERSLGRLSLDGNELCLRMPRDARSRVRDQATRADIPLAVRYLAASGHDLRTPLNAILGFSDLVAMHPHEQWSEAQHRSLSIVRERARDLASMVDDMIDWAKLELGDLRLSQKQHDCRELIERAVSLAVERSGARGLRVEVEVEPALGQLYVDADRFVQALLGLMDHAVRAMPGPTVRVHALRDPKGGARFEVIDSGLEIRSQDQAHIFAAFRPSFAPTGQRVAGLHLGTSLSRALIRAHGGDVWFESRPDQGTTFVASLPDVCLA
jgi:signal transduction histidine kinase